MEKQDEVVKQLKSKYKPLAILLHGSRAVGKSRAHSDWDIYLLFAEKPKQKFNREEIAGEDIEWKAFQAPIIESDIEDTFGVTLQFAKVLWESAGDGTKLLEEAVRFYSKGVHLSGAERAKYKQFMVHKVHGMEDDIETPYMFLRHLSELFNRAVNWWFELRGDYRKPFYIALPYIKEHDPEYHDLLMTLCGEESKQKKISAGKQVVTHLFP